MEPGTGPDSLALGSRVLAFIVLVDSVAGAALGVQTAGALHLRAAVLAQFG